MKEASQSAIRRSVRLVPTFTLSALRGARPTLIEFLLMNAHYHDNGARQLRPPLRCVFSWPNESKQVGGGMRAHVRGAAAAAARSTRLAGPVFDLRARPSLAYSECSGDCRRFRVTPDVVVFLTPSSDGRQTDGIVPLEGRPVSGVSLTAYSRLPLQCTHVMDTGVCISAVC